MSKTYTTRPPASARAARRAWDYFSRKYPKRKIETLAYSQSCDGIPGWVCELERPANATLCWGTAYSCDWWLKSAPAETIRRSGF